MKALDIITGILMIVGALNWGLVGLFDLNLVAALFGEMTIVSRIIYVLVALSAVYHLVAMKPVANRLADRPAV